MRLWFRLVVRGGGVKGGGEGGVIVGFKHLKELWRHYLISRGALQHDTEALQEHEGERTLEV